MQKLSIKHLLLIDDLTREDVDLIFKTSFKLKKKPYKKVLKNKKGRFGKKFLIFLKKLLTFSKSFFRMEKIAHYIVLFIFGVSFSFTLFLLIFLFFKLLW